MKNYRSDLTLIVTRLHGTLTASNVFALLHPASIPAVGVLAFGGLPGAATTNLWTYFKGGISPVKVVRKGATTVTTYTFVGGLPSSTALTPNPLS